MDNFADTGWHHYFYFVFFLLFSWPTYLQLIWIRLEPQMRSFDAGSKYLTGRIFFLSLNRQCQSTDMILLCFTRS